jgi:hypothetical protein
VVYALPLSLGQDLRGGDTWPGRRKRAVGSQGGGAAPPDVRGEGQEKGTGGLGRRRARGLGAAARVFNWGGPFI